MDRVNRSLLVASTLLAIPAALLMASLTIGADTEVELAVGQPNGDSDAVQQVVGKQFESRKTRPGLLQVISGAAPAGDRNHHHHNMPEDEPKGLLDGLFDNSDRSSSRRRSSTRPTPAAPVSRAGSSHRSSSSRGDVNWSGIPFHRADSGSTRTTAAPIRDPQPRSASTSGGTRIIRGGSQRSVPAKTASVRRSDGPTLARPPAEPLAEPSVARKLAPIRSSAKGFSTSSSSRRSNRRSVEALDPSEIAAASRTTPATPAETATKPATESSTADLVPKVVRQEKKPEPKPAAKPEPATADVAKSKNEARTEPPAAKASEPEQAGPKQAEPKQAGPKQAGPKTALATIGAPTASSADEPRSAADVTEAEASYQASEPTAAPGPAYTTPVDPTTSPIPVAGIPTHPYAASTPTRSYSIPAAPVSHRSGPPQAAFGPGQIAQAPPQPGAHANPNPYAGAQPPYGQSPVTSQSPVASQPYPQARFNAASSPVGSGIVPNSDVASYRRPSAPVYNPGSESSYSTADPYAQPQQSRGRMTTYGQPVASQPAAAAATRPPHETAAIPMAPIRGYAPTAAPTDAAADNFSASTYDSRNQMRDSVASSETDTMQPDAMAATSELPGIRVMTRGPRSIMIRQTSQYEIRVENRGSIDAEGVLVRALVPDWAEVHGQNATRGDVDNEVEGTSERLVWTIDHLPAGASEQMYVRLKAARSGTYDLDVDWTLVPQKSIAKVQVREPRLDLTIEGPDEVIYGQSQTYKVRVLNPGDGTAPNVVFTLSPNSATPQTERIGDIPPGKEAQFDVELTAQDLGDLKIHGLAAGELELRAEAAKTIRVAAAKLEAVLTGPELKYQNSDAMYSLQLQNNGSAASQKIMATLRMPTGVKYLGGIDEAAVQGNALRWEITSLEPGATRNYQFRCNMTSTGEHLFAFDCRGTAAGNTDVSIATRVESIADLVLSVSDPAAPAPIGSDVTYEIVIRNRGSKEATDVRAIAQFSHGIEPQRIEGQSGEVVTGQVLFDPIPRIGAGQEVRMRVIAQADRAGHHRFRTEVRSGDTVLVAEEATHYMSPQSDRVSRRSSDAAKR